VIRSTWRKGWRESGEVAAACEAAGAAKGAERRRGSRSSPGTRKRTGEEKRKKTEKKGSGDAERERFCSRCERRREKSSSERREACALASPEGRRSRLWRRDLLRQERRSSGGRRLVGLVRFRARLCGRRRRGSEGSGICSFSENFPGFIPRSDTVASCTEA
jgi:hypothetical protein